MSGGPPPTVHMLSRVRQRYTPPAAGGAPAVRPTRRLCSTIDTPYLQPAAGGPPAVHPIRRRGSTSGTPRRPGALPATRRRRSTSGTPHMPPRVHQRYTAPAGRPTCGPPRAPYLPAAARSLSVHHPRVCERRPAVRSLFAITFGCSLIGQTHYFLDASPVCRIFACGRSLCLTAGHGNDTKGL